MNSELLVRGLLYLSAAVVGIPGNMVVICTFLSLLHHERRLLTADIILLHLAAANLTVDLRCIFEVLTSFQILDFFHDAGCKGILYVFRTARAFSIWLTFVLSAYQSLSIAPPGSFWAAVRDVFARFLWIIFLIVWIICFSSSCTTIIYSWSVKNLTTMPQNSIKQQFCHTTYPSITIKDSIMAMETVRDVVPIVLMTTASLIILIFLYKHSQQVKGLRGGAAGGRSAGGGSAEHRAAITVVTLVTLYVLLYGFDCGLWVYTIVVRETFSSAFITDMRIFCTFVFAAVSPIVIIVSNKKVNKHLRCGREEKTLPASEVTLKTGD